MKIKLMIINIERIKDFSQDEIVEWCFKNISNSQWGIKVKDGDTCLYFERLYDAEMAAEHFNSPIEADD